MKKTYACPRLWKILALPAALLATPAAAQVSLSIGPVMGVNLAMVRYEDIPNQPAPPDISYRGGLSSGLVASIEHQHFALRPALLFSIQGFVLNSEYAVAGRAGERNYYHQEYRLNYLKAPVSIAYALHRDGMGLQLLAGAYVSLVVGGKVRYDNRFEAPGTTEYYRAEQPVRAGSRYPDFNAFYTKRFDAGLQAGVGYRWKQLLAQAAYQVGLVDVGATYPSPSPSSPSFYNRNLEGSLAYFLFGR